MHIGANYILIPLVVTCGLAGCRNPLAQKSLQVTTEPVSESLDSARPATVSTVSTGLTPTRASAGLLGSELAEESGQGDMVESVTENSTENVSRSDLLAADEKSIDAMLGSMGIVDPATRDLARRQILAARNRRHRVVTDNEGDAGETSIASEQESPAAAASLVAADTKSEDSEWPEVVTGLASSGTNNSAGQPPEEAKPQDSESATVASTEEKLSPGQAEEATPEIALASATLPADAMPVAQDPAEPHAMAPTDPSELTQQLIKQLEESSLELSTPEGFQQLLLLRSLYALNGRIDEAAEPVEGLEESEQQYLQNQLLALGIIADSAGSPVRSRRYVEALPRLRDAVSYLGAATGSLDVRNVQFCTHVLSYGVVKPFPTNRYKSGQHVLLYCEVNNFDAEKTSEGYETHIQGVYELFDSKGKRIFDQVLPPDQDRCPHYRRDYYVAWELYLPRNLPTGAYRLRLTMEDVKGRKYGQSDLQFEIVE